MPYALRTFIAVVMLSSASIAACSREGSASASRSDPAAEAAAASAAAQAAMLAEQQRLAAEAQRRELQEREAYRAAIDVVMERFRAQYAQSGASSPCSSAALGALDVSATPPEFQQAFFQHLAARQECTAAETSILNAGTSLDAWKQDNLRSLIGQERTAEADFRRNAEMRGEVLRQAKSQARATFAELAAIAGSYGARVSYVSF